MGQKATSQYQLASEELALLRAVCHFEEVVFDAADSFSPNLLCSYLYDLAQQFNMFYQKYKVVGSPEEEQRVLITQAVGQVLHDGLNLLGIDAPEKI